MARVSNYALPEHWTRLNAARQQLSVLGDDVAAIKRKCEETHDKKHVLQCTDCYRQVLDRMFARYRDHKEGEWFSQRSAFVFGLETLFSEAKDRKLHLQEIEAQIDSEKEAWYRWVLRRHTEFLAVSEGADQDEVRSILDDPDRSREELVSMVWQAVGKPDSWESRVDAFSEKVAAAAGDSVALKKIYVDEFFKDPATGQVPDEARPYFEQYEASPDVRLEDIVDKIVYANRDGKSSQAQKDTHQRRLDELRRAKTAFEQNRVRNKSLHNGTAAQTVSEKLYNLPPCSTCEKEVDAKDVLSCALCQAASQLGGEGLLLVYCSEPCYHKGQEEHIEKAHQCEAKDKCTNLMDEDEVMEDEASDAVVCKECLDRKAATIFCSQRCAAENLGAHRQEKHDAKTDPAEAQALTMPMEQFVEQTLQQENPGLTFSWAS